MAKKVSISKDSIFLMLNLILALLTMGLVAALTGRVMAEDLDQVAFFLGLTILSQVLFQILLLLIKKKKKDKLRAFIVGVIYAVGMGIAFVATKHYMLFFIANSLVIFAMAINQLLLVEKEETKKGIVTNILLGFTLIFLGVAIIIVHNEDDTLNISLVSAALFLFSSLRKVLFPSLKLEKIKLLINILVKTHTIDTIICLVAFMIAFSFALPIYEDSITNFWDAMWYCFTVITTIGFGDFAAESLVGRILTVILGIYGIVVVAILTSVVVNFYNEVSAKEKARDIIE